MQTKYSVVYFRCCLSGGLGDTVAGALSEERDVCIKKLAVSGVPRSGKAAELVEMFGISANNIVKAVHSMLK